MHSDKTFATADHDPRADQILAIVAKETSLDVAALRPDATIEELGIASLDLTQAVFAIESTFDIEIPVVAERTGAEFTTIGELVSHVLRVLDEAGKTREAALATASAAGRTA